MALFSDPPPRRNPVLRADRRRSLDNATSEEWTHIDHAKRELSFLSCWFCWHEPGEHLDHDWLIDDCPDCRYDGSTRAG